MDIEESPHADVLADLPIWMPRGKNKSPQYINSTGVFTGVDWDKSEHWMTYDHAQAIVEANPGLLTGVGIVIDKNTVSNGKRLVAIDVDLIDGYHKAEPDKGVTAITFDPIADADKVRQIVPLIGQIDTYWEASPSCTGVHAIAWATEAWAAKFANTGKFYPGGCDHAEFYTGEASTYITVTGVGLGPCTTIGVLSDAVQAYLGPLLTPVSSRLAAPPEIGDEGTPLDLSRFNLIPDQHHLVDGTGDIDRSKHMMGLAINLLDNNATQEDVFATFVQEPKLWQYLMDHRNNNEEKALQFAREEINRAWLKSMAGRREALIGYNDKWKPAAPKKGVAFPAPYPGPMADAVAAGLDAAHKPQPELTTMATLSAMAATCGSFYRQRDGSRLNLYFLGIAKTGTGKDLPLRLAKQLGRLGNAKLIGTPGSGQGLEDSLASSIATYCTVDEIAHFFSAMNDPRASSYERANARKLLELFSASSDEYETRALAGKEARIIHHPAFNLIGFTTPEKLGSAFHPDDFADGLAGRILFVFTDSNPVGRRLCKPIELPNSFKQVAMQVKNGLTFLLITGETVIGITEGAEQMLDQLLAEFDQRGRTGDSPYECALCVRSLEKVERLAGVLAVWDNPAKPVITTAHIEWTAQFVRASNAAVLSFVHEHMHGGIEQENAASLMKMIRDGTTRSNRKGEIAASKAGWTPRSALLRRSKMDVQSFDRAIRNLSERGEIVVGPFEKTNLQVIGLSRDE